MKTLEKLTQLASKVDKAGFTEYAKELDIIASNIVFKEVFKLPFSKVPHIVHPFSF